MWNSKSIVSRTLWKSAMFLGLKNTTIAVDGDAYLTRFYLFHRWRDYLPGVFLHYFWRGDKDRDCHNHPWTWSVSLILWGGYTEERQKGLEITTRKLGPGSINVIKRDDYHRVDLLREGCWSLFVAAPRPTVGNLDWGFLDRDTGIPYSREEYRRRQEEKLVSLFDEDSGK